MPMLSPIRRKQLMLQLMRRNTEEEEVLGNAVELRAIRHGSLRSRQHQRPRSKIDQNLWNNSFEEPLVKHNTLPKRGAISLNREMAQSRSLATSPVADQNFGTRSIYQAADRSNSFTEITV